MRWKYKNMCVRKASVNMHRKSLSLAVKLDVNPAEGLKSLDWLGSTLQSVLKSDDKMQECKEIEKVFKGFEIKQYFEYI